MTDDGQVTGRGARVAPMGGLPRGPAALFAVLASLVVAALWGLSAVRTATNAWAFPAFVALAVLAIYAPGRLAILGLGLGVTRRLDRVTLALAVGMPLAALAYALCVAAGARRLFWLWPLGALALTLHPRFRPRAGAALGGIRYAHSMLLGVLACVLARLALSPPCFPNLARTPEGGLTFYGLADVFLHASVANELTHSVPPMNPFLPGRALSYHYGMHLLAALFTPFGLDVMDLTVRFIPALLLVFLVLAAFCFARAWPLPEAAATLVPFLVALGEDLSFIPGLFTASPEPWAVWFHGAPGTASFYLLNPLLPATGLLMATLLALRRFFDSEEPAWLVVGGVTAVALFEAKVFVAAHLLAALGITGVVHAWRLRRWTPLRATVAAGAAMMPFVLTTWMTNTGRVRVALEPWPYVPALVYRIGLGDSVVGRAVGDFFLGRITVASTLAFFGVGVPLYLIVVYGGRLAGGWAFARALVRPRGDDAARMVVASMIALGPILSFLFAVSPAGYPSREYYNNAIWFLVVSKHVSWLFAVEAMASIPRRRFAVAGLALLVASSLPATVDLVVRSWKAPPARLSARTVRMLEHVRRAVPPGSVCLAREEVAEAVIVASSCRSLHLGVFPYSFLSPSEQASLRARRDAFWADWRGATSSLAGEGRVRYDLLGELGADYVIAHVPSDGIPKVLSGQGWGLEQRYLEEFAVFRVEGKGVGRASPGPGGTDAGLPPTPGLR